MPACRPPAQRAWCGSEQALERDGGVAAMWRPLLQWLLPALLLISTPTAGWAGDRLVVALSGGATTLDPHQARTGADFQYFEHLYDTLVTRDGFNIAPRLASNWSGSVDYRVWSFTLAANATFANGRPVTFADVAYSLCRHQTLAQAAGRDLLGLTQVSSTGKGQVTLTLAEPYRLLPAALSLLFIVAAPDNAGDGPLGCDPDRVKPVTRIGQLPGSGPYVPSTEPAAPGQAILTASPHCWSECPGWQRLVLWSLPDARERLRLLVTGAADIMEDVAPSQLPYLATVKGLRLTELPTDRTLLLTFNLRPDLVDGTRNPLSDIRVRRAIAMVIDRHLLVERGLEGFAGPAWQLAQPGMEGYLPDRPHRMLVQPDTARDLLAAAGYGSGLHLDLLLPITRVTDRPRVADALAGMLRTIGIDLTVTPVPATEVRQKVARGDFQMMFSGLGLTAGSAMEGYVAIAGTTEKDSTSNPSGYRNDALLDLLHRARGVDPRDIPTLSARATTILENDLPMIPLMHIRDLAAHRAGLSLHARDTARAFGRITGTVTADAGKVPP